MCTIGVRLRDHRRSGHVVEAGVEAQLAEQWHARMPRAVVQRG